MSRLLKINGTIADIDDKTAIGINYQTYDVREPGKRFVITSNNFTIPATNANLAKFGYPSSIESTSNKVYEVNTCDYYIGQNHIIKNAKIRVDSIFNGRIKVFVFDKADIWDLLKTITWDSFAPTLLTWLQDNEGVYSETSKYTTKNPGTGVAELGEFVADVNSGTGLHLAFLYSVPYNDTAHTNWPVMRLDERNTAYTKNGGYWNVFCTQVFKAIEDTYSIDFGTDDTASIFNDTFANSIYVPFRSVVTRMDIFDYLGTPSPDAFWFEYEAAPEYYPLESVVDKPDATLYDFIDSYFKLLNVVPLPSKDAAGVESYLLKRFDDIDLTGSKDWSDRIDVISSFNPVVSGLAQNNYIKYEAVGEGLLESYNQTNIECGNLNINYESDLFSLKAFAPNFISRFFVFPPNIVGANMTGEDSFAYFTFFVDSSADATYGVVKTIDNNGVSNVSTGEKTPTPKLKNANIISLDNEYLLFRSALDKPKFYTVNMWLTLTDMLDFNYFTPVFIKELGGTFFVNKISGYNPTKSNVATKVELLKLSDDAPSNL